MKQKRSQPTVFLALILYLFLPAFLSRVQGQTNPEDLARQVTIYRDSYGIPHVHGETDAAAVFGLMYALAEDNFYHIERNILTAIGRFSEVNGEESFGTDLRVRALETERHSREEYKQASRQFRAIAEAWAHAFNYYLAQHPEQHYEVLSHFEPWHMFALGRIISAYGVPSSSPEGPAPADLEKMAVDGAVQNLSNMWMIGPERSESGHAMLLINPHVSLDASLSLREGHLLSEEGMNIYGAFWPGYPFPIVGHSPHHGWAITVDLPDLLDLYELSFDHPTDSLSYRYGDSYRGAEIWTENLTVTTDSGMVDREVSFRKSHHGPIVAIRDGKPLAMRIARYEEGGLFQQLHSMARAESLEEFQKAVGSLSLMSHNIGYADREGNIWYLYNSAVPKRNEKFNYDLPLDGSDPETEWQGYHSMEELPQVLNPECGWIVNTNTSPFIATSEGENPDPALFPKYMVGETPQNPVHKIFASHSSARWKASKDILTRPGIFSFEEWIAAATSRKVFQAEEDIPALLAEWRDLADRDEERAEKLRPAIDSLEKWDQVSSMESTAMTLYTRWSVDYRTVDGGSPSWGYFQLMPIDTLPWGQIRALEKTIAALERDWSTPFVPWGEFFRLQRPLEGEFSDARPSVPVAGGPALFGMIHDIEAMPAAGQKRWYGRGGNSYVSVIEFGPKVRARSIMPFGQSNDPQSPHYEDQSELFGRGEFKKVWTSLEDVKNNAVQIYRPGQ
ncbi:penicillin acylase family protein [Cyclobacterium roseum]|uniref:penicillin acylase family protein n=1 Tax=Cyclobacterium roseum TaxID=2666137 RepID=UPI0013919D43|nr:penicillin acylase family protein [Cyclobacterium roseum]